MTARRAAAASPVSAAVRCDDAPALPPGVANETVRLMPCGCVWVGDFPADPWLEPQVLACGCEWFGFPGRAAWLAGAVVMGRG